MMDPYFSMINHFELPGGGGGLFGLLEDGGGGALCLDTDRSVWKPGGA